MEIEMKLKGLVVDPISKTPIVLLEDPASEMILPIWIGSAEANAIALTIENIQTPRPMTHDLLRDALSRFEVDVERVVVTDVRNNTFYAAIHCRRLGMEVVLDSRPSDAIALALRAGARIYAEESVVRRAHGLRPEDALESSENLRKWLEALTPEDMGKYKM